ncbi:MAG: bifunctional methyltransferase/pyrophosphohydrolase YabN [Chloroflexota bacterium]
MASGSITIVGLGPGAGNQVTVEARDVLAAAREIWLRTTHHPVVPSLPAGPAVRSFDYLYDEKETFAEVYTAIVQHLLGLAKQGEDVVYAVPGHPLVGERSVEMLLGEARAAGIATAIVAGLSFLEPTFSALQLDPLAKGLQVLDAMDLASLTDLNRGEPAVRPGFLPTAPLLLAQIYNRRIASGVKIQLLEYYSPRHEVTLLRWAGVPGQEEVRTLPLYTLDRIPEVDHLCCLYVPALDPVDDLAGFEGLRYVIARLRAPGGCPWDREQTHDSLKPYLIEEAYEALDALDLADVAKISEELGDLLLQVVLHAQVGEEAGEFSMEDVLRGINAKLIRRHPHVFGDISVRDSAEVLRNWAQIKRTEHADEEKAASLLGEIPRQLPALAYALSVQKRAARAGFDWTEMGGVEGKVAEELKELKAAEGPDEKMQEMGDLLFAVVNLARWMKVDPEEALRLTNQRFRSRFRRMEELCAERGLDLASLSLADQDELWEEAKREERGSPPSDSRPERGTEDAGPSS